VAQVFATGKLTVTGGIIGTAEYMSPEQAQGKRAGKQSDLYSLGAVMYAMITGRPPFSGSAAVEVIQKHKYGVFDRPRSFVPDLPKRVDETICRLLEKDPTKRFPDALVLLRHLEQTLQLENYAEAGATIIASEPRNGGQATIPADDEAGAAPSLGPATLMQTLMRAELANVLHGGIISAIFNNTFVLIGLLALVIAGGVWFLRPHELTEEELFERGKSLLSSEEGPEWIRAKRDYFDKLLERDAERWSEEVEPFLQKIDAYEASRRMSRGRRSAAVTPKTESERLLQLAQFHRQAGDFHRAERILESLKALLAGDEKQAKLRDVVDKTLAEVRQQIEEASGREELLSAALERATKLVRDGNSKEAVNIWRGIIELYQDDPAVREFVRQAEEGLSRQASP
jgi:serine/threonine-protein kinase